MLIYVNERWHDALVHIRTGNVVFLGFSMASVPGISMARSAAALAASAIGAVCGGQLAARMGSFLRNRWAGIAFGIASILLLAAAGVAVGAGNDLMLRDPARLYSLIALTGLAIATRNVGRLRCG
jgi:hypothetical protein